MAILYDDRLREWYDEWVTSDTEKCIEPSSVDLHLGSEIIDFELVEGAVDPFDHTSYPRNHYHDSNGYELESGQFALAHTEEIVGVPPHLVGHLHGKSSIGRLGLFIHNAGLIDPGFMGEITLELYNASPNPIRLYEDMEICQITLTELTGPAANPYGSRNGNKYEGQLGVTPSRYHQNQEP